MEKRKGRLRRKYGPLLKAGIKAQLEKLIENEHKKPPEELSLLEIVEIIFEEQEELWREIMVKEVDVAKARREAADLANGCHFLIQWCDKRMKEE